MCTEWKRGHDNDYTCISTKGKSVMDYAWVPHGQLHFWHSFKVQRMSKLIESFELHAPFSVPDHSLISWELKLARELLTKNAPETEREVCELYDVHSLPSDFFNDDYIMQMVQEIIVAIEEGS